MSVAMLVLRVASLVLSFILLYQLFFAFFALGKPALPAKGKKNHRFALVISARNEQSVLPMLLDSLNQQHYPRECYDIFVVADNCTDHTAHVAWDHGAIVYERFNREQVGKGYALQWFFRSFLVREEGKYDAVAIFDADNLVDPGYLSAMNDQLGVGEVAAMGYRDSKNPYDNWVSGGSSMIWWTLSRFYHLPRQRMGLSALAGGTGYMFRIDLLADGWNTQTICEDIEFSMQLMAKGHRIAYAPQARFYDEQPTQLTASIHQRYRWAVGSMQCVKVCMPDLLRAACGPNRSLAADAILYLGLTPLVGFQLLVSLTSFALNFFLPISMWPAAFGPSIAMWAVGWLLCVGQGGLLLWLEGKSIRRLWKALLLYPIYLSFSAVINLVTFFYRNPVWRPIAHQKAVALRQIS